jgi:hypothetical protein
MEALIEFKLKFKSRLYFYKVNSRFREKIFQNGHHLIFCKIESLEKKKANYIDLIFCKIFILKEQNNKQTPQ